jgi:hypothetical protein
MYGLERPEATQEEWRLQLGLTEVDHLGSVVFQEIVDDLLFGLRVETSDIEGDEFELLPFGFHFREISLDPRSVFVGECISSVFSVVCSTPTVTLIFVSGLLLPWCHLSFRILGGRVPLSPWVFCKDSYFCCPSRWSSTLSIFFCVSLVAVGKSGVVVFGRHCCCSVAPWCPLVALLTPLSESLLSAPSYSAHVTFFVTPVC